MSLKILIIEDEPDIRKNLEYNLSREGYYVLTAASIAEAEELIYSNNERMNSYKNHLKKHLLHLLHNYLLQSIFFYSPNSPF